MVILFIHMYSFQYLFLIHNYFNLKLHINFCHLIYVMSIIINYLIKGSNKFYLVFKFLFQNYKCLLLRLMVQGNKIYFIIIINKVLII